MNEESLQNEVRRLIEEKIDAGQVVRVNWIAAEVMQNHPDIDGADAAFYRTCTRLHLPNVIKKATKRYEDREDRAPDHQMVLPGFERMQKAYLVHRDGQPLLVPIDMMADEELAQRADLYVAFSRGNLAHAKELREYLRRRQAVA